MSELSVPVIKKQKPVQDAAEWSRSLDSGVGSESAVLRLSLWVTGPPRAVLAGGEDMWERGARSLGNAAAGLEEDVEGEGCRETAQVPVEGGGRDRAAVSTWIPGTRVTRWEKQLPLRRSAQEASLSGQEGAVVPVTMAEWARTQQGKEQVGGCPGVQGRERKQRERSGERAG